MKAISAGFHHNLAVRPDGTVAAWGWNVTGQLGDGTTTDRWRPQSVSGSRASLRWPAGRCTAWPWAGTAGCGHGG